MNGSPRLGLLTPGWPGQNTPNGIATAVYNLAIGLKEIGETPVILAFNIDGECPPDIPVIPVPKIEWRWQDRLRARLGDWQVLHQCGARALVAAIHKATAEHAIDVLVIEETNGWAAMVAPRISVPIIVTLHGPWVLHKSLGSSSATENARRERRERKGFQAAAGIIAPSHNVLEAVEKTVSLSSTPTIVLPNSIAESPSLPVASALPSRDILFVGRFDFHKGGDIVLDAFSRLSQNHPDARLTFAGPDRGVKQPDGSQRHIDVALADLPEPARRAIDYKGAIDRTEVSLLRQRHAIAVIASRYENLNYTLLEAMLAGQAIVCTDVGGPAEVLEHNVTSLLVPSEDPQAMAAALAELLDDPERTRQLGAAARAKAFETFGAHKVAAQTLAFAKTVLESTKG